MLHGPEAAVNDQRIAIKQRFEDDGQAIADWARSHGYKASTVYAVIRGQLKGKRGIGHRIAVDLGLKKRRTAA